MAPVLSNHLNDCPSNIASGLTTTHQQRETYDGKNAHVYKSRLTDIRQRVFSADPFLQLNRIFYHKFPFSPLFPLNRASGTAVAAFQKNAANQA
jgi:hypothetical protein